MPLNGDCKLIYDSIVIVMAIVDDLKPGKGNYSEK